MSAIQPFANEEDALAIGDFNIENRLDRISLYGSLEITKDKNGLKDALALKNILDAAIAVLQSAPLPDHVQVKPAKKVENPFK